ncbi:MAG: IS110 family transposase, partial [Maioricimonas sp. JB049]
MNEKFIALYVHKSFSQAAVMSSNGQIRRCVPLPTTIPDIVDFIHSVKRPRRLTFEEGPLAGWLARNLFRHVDELIVCEPRRNHLICKEDDKNDPLDARKLAALYRAGMLKPVHHALDPERQALKHATLLHLDLVRDRVALGNQLVNALSQHGRFVTATQARDRSCWLRQLEELPDCAFLHLGLERLRERYEFARQQEQVSLKQLHGVARNIAEVRRFREVPGVGWLRGLVFYVIVDTPHRFSSDSAYVKYCGLGLKEKQSGKAKKNVSVSRVGNRRLKNILNGAAECCARKPETPYGARFFELQRAGHSRSQARRTVARQIARTLRSLWIHDTDYDEGRVRNQHHDGQAPPHGSQPVSSRRQDAAMS